MRELLQAISFDPGPFSLAAPIKGPFTLGILVEASSLVVSKISIVTSSETRINSTIECATLHLAKYSNNIKY